MSTYRIHIGHFDIDLPLRQINDDGFSVYSFNMIGQAAWNTVAAEQLKERLIGIEPIDVLLTAEAKAIAMTQELARLLDHKRYVVLRKSRKGYMQDPIDIAAGSITSGASSYWIERDDLDYLKGKRVLLVDDVISTGGTAKAFLGVAEKTACDIVGFAAALSEGTDWKSFEGVPVFKLDHIPLPGVANGH